MNTVPSLTPNEQGLVARLALVEQERDEWQQAVNDVGILLMEEKNKREEVVVEALKLLAESNERKKELERIGNVQKEFFEKCRKREHEIVRALRALVEALAPQPPTSLTYFAGGAFAKAVKEAIEVLAIIDAQKTT